MKRQRDQYSVFRSHVLRGLWSALFLLGLPATTVPQAHGATARGGTVTNYVQNGTHFTAHIFTTVGTTSLTVTAGGKVEVLLVGGGGGGAGGIGGGGGGGGVVYVPSLKVTAGSYTILVGGGGPGGVHQAVGGAGTNSTAFGIIAAGGGGGGSFPDVGGLPGGSGGGAGGAQGAAPAGGLTNGSALGDNTGTIYGNRGGNQTAPRSGDPTSARGGGGAGAAGADENGNNTSGGHGGAGIMNAILGVTYYWGGGGAGAAHTAYPGGNGGLGGGGGGAAYNTAGGGFGGTNALNAGGNASIGESANGAGGGANTGGGGGGGTWQSSTGGDGGSGIVIVRYLSFSARNEGASDVTGKSAMLKGCLDGDGGSPASVCVLWGAKDGGGTWDWEKTDWIEGEKRTDSTPFGKKLTGLTANKTYYYTVGAKTERDKTLAGPSVAFITGEVNLKAAQDQAWEKGPEGATVPAALTVSRPASCVETPLPVAYAVSGTASNGLDYPALSGTVTIPAGATDADIVVAPGNDRIVEGDETVVVTLLSGPYVLGADGTATITIVDTSVRSFYVSPDATPAPPYDTWATGFRSLQDALDAPVARGDAVIYLAGGKTFTGPAVGKGDYDNTVFRWRNATNVQLLGGYRADVKLAPAAHPGPRDAGPTILSGAGTNARVLTMSAVGGADLEQLTIRDGQPRSRRGLGGGLCLIGCRDVVLRGCEIVGNRNVHSFVGMGGGLYLEDSAVDAADTTIAGNSVAGPDSYGGGVYVHRDSRLTLTRSTIRGNQVLTTDNGFAKGGAYYVAPGGVLEFDGTMVRENKP